MTLILSLHWRAETQQECDSETCQPIPRYLLYGQIKISAGLFEVIIALNLSRTGFGNHSQITIGETPICSDMRAVALNFSDDRRNDSSVSLCTLDVAFALLLSGVTCHLLQGYAQYPSLKRIRICNAAGRLIALRFPDEQHLCLEPFIARPVGRTNGLWRRSFSCI